MLIKQFALSVLAVLTFFTYATIVWSDEPKNYRELIFDTGNLKPVDSILNIKIGDLAPDFTLPSL